jgi:hypothetical protein
MNDALNFYRQHSPSTDPGAHADLLRDLPTDLPGLHQVVQNILIHNWKVRARYPELAHPRDLLLSNMLDLLERVRLQDPRPLMEERAIQDKLIVDCRHFAAVLCALLRQQGIPARTRCGFGAYLEEGWAQDHYVTEYWNAAESRWVLEDPDIVMHDVARDAFIVGGQAWQDSRAGKDDPMRFACGPDLRGYDTIRFNLGKDLAQLNKDEEMSLAGWGLPVKEHDQITTDDEALLDTAAAHTLADNNDFDTMHSFYLTHDILLVTPQVICFNYIENTWQERPALVERIASEA